VQKAGLKQLSGGKIANQSAVGSKKIVAWQIFKAHPFELGKDLVLEFAFKGVDCKKLQIDGAAVAIVMADVCDAPANGGFDSELFVQFPSKGLFRTLASLDLAAGKLPLQGHRLIGASLAYEHFAAANEKARSNET